MLNNNRHNIHSFFADLTSAATCPLLRSRTPHSPKLKEESEDGHSSDADYAREQNVYSSDEDSSSEITWKENIYFPITTSHSLSSEVKLLDGSLLHGSVASQPLNSIRSVIFEPSLLCITLMLKTLTCSGPSVP